MRNKVIIWTSGIDKFWDEKGMVGGLTVQMSLWSKIFFKKGWEVYSFSDIGSHKQNGCKFIYFPQIRYIGIFVDCILSLFFILKIRPSVILFRGASRNLSFVCMFSKIIKTKFIFLGASDANFDKGKELLPKKLDVLLYRFGLRHTKLFVTQNLNQHYLLKSYYNKDSLIIPNIWDTRKINTSDNRQSILWVANFRKVKRPKLFIDLAKNFPNYNFIMIGGANDKNLYNHCIECSKDIKNLKILGQQKFSDVNKYFTKAKILICTSKFEGFPNTFLQAWANEIPILSTFDPSNIIKNKKLGLIANDFKGLVSAFHKITTEKNLYSSICKNINLYFSKNHATYTMYDKLINHFNIIN